MVLRDLAGGAARMSAGFWKEVARAIEPDRPGRRSTPPRADPSAPTSPATPTATPPGAPTDERATEEPEGVLVPVDTWARVLDQLGHLHEAGRELAEARERAAKAETQVEFLREQLTEAKARPKRQRSAAKPAAPPAAKTARSPRTPAPEVTSPPAGAGSRVGVVRTAGRVRIDRARNRVSTWLQVE